MLVERQGLLRLENGQGSELQVCLERNALEKRGSEMQWDSEQGGLSEVLRGGCTEWSMLRTFPGATREQRPLACALGFAADHSSPCSTLNWACLSKSSPGPLAVTGNSF